LIERQPFSTLGTSTRARESKVHRPKSLRLAAEFLVNAFVMLSGNEDTALRLGAALIVGTILSLNRELHGKPAGLRTHALVSVLTALVLLLGRPLERLAERLFKRHASAPPDHSV
jgi:hypothetical protein